MHTEVGLRRRGRGAIRIARIAVVLAVTGAVAAGAAPAPPTRAPAEPTTLDGFLDAGTQALRAADYEAAQAHFESALVRAETLGPTHPRVGTCLTNLAEVLRRRGNLTEAFEQGRRAVTVWEAQGRETVGLARALNNLAEIHRGLEEVDPDAGHLDQSIELFKRSLAIREAALPGGSPEIAVAHNNLAVALVNAGEMEKAQLHYEQAIETLEAAYGTREHAQVAQAINNLAVLHDNQGNLSQAGVMYRQAIKIQEKVLGLRDPALANTMHNLGVLYHRQGDLKSAEAQYRRALSIRERVLGRKHPDVANTLTQLVELYWRTGRGEKATGLELRLRKIQAEQREAARELADPANEDFADDEAAELGSDAEE